MVRGREGENGERERMVRGRRWNAQDKTERERTIFCQELDSWGRSPVCNSATIPLLTKVVSFSLSFLAYVCISLVTHLPGISPRDVGFGFILQSERHGS